MRNHCGTPLSNASTPVDTNHRRKPAPAMSDCGHDPRSQLKLTYSAPKVPGDEKFWHSLISSVSAFQLPSRCPPPQIQLLGLLLDLKNRTEMRLTKSPPLQTRRIMHTWHSQSMGAFTVAPRPSSTDVRPTSNSVPEKTRAQKPLNSGWPAGSPDESNTETNQPHDAFFMKRRALFTSLWKIWVATIWIQQTKS